MFYHSSFKFLFYSYFLTLPSVLFLLFCLFAFYYSKTIEAAEAWEVMEAIATASS